jgi:predicted unusual protein kinase regulating ubiquinone biosynthesis (AarF/ABC1/UbiB family)
VVIPQVFAEYSGNRVLTTEFIEGVAVDSAEVSALTQAQRNHLAEIFLKVYFRELFELRAMQTDPHFGNYRIRIADQKLVLLDFGAVRRFSKEFLKDYRLLVEGSVTRDRKKLIAAAEGLGFLEPTDPQGLIDIFCELCELICEPFEGGIYDWSQGNLPKRVMKLGSEMALKFKLRAPPREILFLDRKMGGVFVFLSQLSAKVDGRPILDAFLKA